MPSLKVFETLKKGGVVVGRSHYDLYDSLECNQDLECLFDVLSKFHDKSGRNPVMTGVKLLQIRYLMKLSEKIIVVIFMNLTRRL